MPSTRYRSLPTYEGEGNQDRNPLIGMTSNYEPIVNTNDSQNTAGYRCDLKGCENITECMARYLKYGPYDFEGSVEEIRTGTPLKTNKEGMVKLHQYFTIQEIKIKEDIKVCYSEFSKRRAIIHGKQEYENGTKVYGGHFYHLLSEYESVVRDKVRDNSRTYHNPI